MEQGGLVEKRLLVIVRGRPVAGADQLAGGFGVMRFVWIPETGNAQTPEEHNKQQYGAAKNRSSRAAGENQSLGDARL